MKIFNVSVPLSFAIAFTVAPIIFGAVFLLGYCTTKQKPPVEKCISEKTLQGCEQAGFDVEAQLRRCEWAFLRCVDTNDILQEKLKGEK